MDFLFYVGDQLPLDAPTPAFLLKPDAWDDYGFRTQFEVFLHLVQNQPPIPVGPVKILARTYPDDDRRRQRTVARLASSFRSLPVSDFCSLGQTSNYYATLANLTLYGLPRDFGARVVVSLADASLAGGVDPWWQAEGSGFERSLLRFPSAHIARRDAATLLAGQVPNEHTVNAIPLSELPSAQVRPSALQIQFDGNIPIPGRINVLVGRNGVGKTTLLVRLARWLSGEVPIRGAENFRPHFSRVIFVSHNAFDSNGLATGTAVGQSLRFVGYRPGSLELLERARHEAATAPSPAEWLSKLPQLFPAPNKLLEMLPSFHTDPTHDLTELSPVREWQQFAQHAFEDDLGQQMVTNPMATVREMSAGQKALASLYAGLFRHLDRQSLVLIDEPENYLHPSLIARFIRTLTDLLANRAAFALIATHSPIVAQETPGRFVWLVHRDANGVLLRHPDFETFGESIDNIDQYLFDTDFKSSHWKRVLRSFVEQGWTDEQIRELFGRDLPLFARAYLELQRLRGSGGTDA